MRISEPVKQAVAGYCSCKAYYFLVFGSFSSFSGCPICKLLLHNRAMDEETSPIREDYRLSFLSPQFDASDNGVIAI